MLLLRALSLVICFACCAMGFAEDAALYRMEGIVTEQGSGQPVAGVKVKVLIESERMANDAVSDVAGKYAVSLPVGHAQAWGIEPPAGYVAVERSRMEPFATSPQKPVFTRNYEVVRGIPWKIAVRAADEKVSTDQAYVGLYQQQGEQFFGVNSQLNDESFVVLTTPAAGGKFQLSCGNRLGSIQAPQGMSLELEQDFDSTAVKSLDRETQGDVTLTDSQGRTACIHGADVILQEGRATILVDVTPRKTGDAGIFRGQVVDDQRLPIAGVEVGLIIGGPEGGSAQSDFRATSDEKGRFEISTPFEMEEGHYSLTLTKAGFGGMDTDDKPWKPGKDQVIDVGAIRLRAGCSLPVRVIDAFGKPLIGAVVEPISSYASRTRITRTDENGDCLVSGLARGRQDLFVRYGNLSANSTLILEPGQNDLLTIKLKPAPRTPQNPGKEEMKELSRIVLELHPGDEAPEWSIAKWTDAKPRKLSDYREKTVVLIFWNASDNNSVSLIPEIKKLQQRFADREVTFLGVHPAGEDLELIQQAAKRYKWDIVTGLDQGKNAADSITWKDYGSPQGLPLMVIDGAGKISFNSSARPKDMQAFTKTLEEVAKSINIPWPIDKDVDPETVRVRMAQVFGEIWSREIEKTLNSPTK